MATVKQAYKEAYRSARLRAQGKPHHMRHSFDRENIANIIWNAHKSQCNANAQDRVCSPLVYKLLNAHKKGNNWFVRNYIADAMLRHER